MSVKAKDYSDLAIVSLAFGIVSFIGGAFFIIPPLLAIIVGHVARHKMKQNNSHSGKKMALVGVILGYLSMGPLLLSFLWLVNSPTEEIVTTNEIQQPQVEAPTYLTLLGEGLSGSGFHFSYKEKLFVATSLHQFDHRQPSQMIHMDLETPIKITDRVFQQKDIQILSFNNEPLSNIDPLIYQPLEDIPLGMPVYLYSFDEPALGHISVKGSLESEYKIQMVDPFKAAGESGSPVVSGITGNVIGVVLSANSPQAATIVGFERLIWED